MAAGFTLGAVLLRHPVVREDHAPSVYLNVTAPGFVEGPFVEKMKPMARPSRHSPEVRERAVRLVGEHRSWHKPFAEVASPTVSRAVRPGSLFRQEPLAERGGGVDLHGRP